MIGVFLLALFFVLESPNFLYLNNRKAECAANLKLISIYNKRDIDLKTIEDSLEHNPSHNHNSSEAVIDNQLSG